MTLELISRREWNAAGPRRTPNVIRASSRKGVVLHWNGPPLRLDPRQGAPALLRRETAIVRAVQRFHQEQQKWSDSAYSYMVGQSGTVFEVRGEDWDQFANGDDVIGANDGSDRDYYTIMVMIGEGEWPTREAIESVKAIVVHLRGLGAGNRVLPHNAFKRKTCPGVELTELAHSLDRVPLAAATTTSEPVAETSLVEAPSIRLKDWNQRLIREASSRSYSAAVELWQRGLLAAGFDPGPIDGLVGSRTKGANSVFAATVGQPAADLPDDVVWPRLLDVITETKKPRGRKGVARRGERVAAGPSKE